MFNFTGYFTWFPYFFWLNYSIWFLHIQFDWLIYLIFLCLFWLISLFDFLIFIVTYYFIGFPFVLFDWLLYSNSFCFIWLTTLLNFLMLNLTDFPWFGRPWGLRDFPLVLSLLSPPLLFWEEPYYIDQLLSFWKEHILWWWMTEWMILSHVHFQTNLREQDFMDFIVTDFTWL